MQDFSKQGEEMYAAFCYVPPQNTNSLRKWLEQIRHYHSHLRCLVTPLVGSLVDRGITQVVLNLLQPEPVLKKQV